MSCRCGLVPHFLAYLSFNVVDSVVMFISTLALFLFISWKLTLALVAVTPLLMLITKLYSKKVRPLFVGMRERLSEMNTTAQENIAGNRVVKAFAREAYEKERFQKRNADFRDANLDINKLWLTFYPFIEILANAMTLITIFVGGLFIILGEITPGELTVFTSLAWALANPMRNLGPLINDLQRFGASANKIIEIYYSRPLIVDRQDAVDHPEPRGRVEFRDVSFSFGSVKVLDHVSFTVEPGADPGGNGAHRRGQIHSDQPAGPVLRCGRRPGADGRLRRTLLEAPAAPSRGGHRDPGCVPLFRHGGG